MKLTESLSDLLFPPKCIVCGEVIERTGEGRLLCPICKRKFMSELSTPCPQCGRKYESCICKPKDFVPDSLTYALPYCSELPISRSMILLSKKRRYLPLFREIASHMYSAALKNSLISEDTVITFVPRAPEKVLSNGVDQAEELAKELSRLSGLKCVSLLKHIPLSHEQKSLGEKLRIINAERNYRLSVSHGKIFGKNIILTDDVVTTGATVNACARLLKDAGAKSVHCLAAAKKIKLYSYYKDN